MKTSEKFRNPVKFIFALAAAAIVIFAFSSCATQAVFLTSPVVPAAQGKVTIKDDGNKNHVIKIKISNLANSQRLQPPKNVYVVWLVTDNELTKNIGQIISSTGTLSKNLKASFETVSSFKPTKIFITAENEADVQYPNSEVILSTDNILIKSN
jgi:hypothetical protein